ncbi:DNA-binding transcriptional regulator, AcrR family [Thermomonospora echinospora]|uniref:DNA-binding transcriptional regulator, AcrR family n=2 Tax=Thermomonospora echinospora TaxID=1992 RepID=A0A1H6AF72_9ACTN|nr:DNA-binding transcriptional regulator, AcrR family [Thermomonospora echinospora]
MTGKERREQLLGIGRTLFAERGLDGTSVEEIAAAAGVSKPVVYEHFGGKEGLYAVVVDREFERLLGLVTDALLAGTHYRQKLEKAALALLEYIEESSDGFRILVRDSHGGTGTGSFASLLSEIAGHVEHLLAREFDRHGYDDKHAPMYAQMLVGMVALTGQWWLDVRKPGREEVAAHVVNLAWNGLSGLEPKPTLDPKRRRKERERLRRVREKEAAKQEKAEEKAAAKAEKAQRKARRDEPAKPDQFEQLHEHDQFDEHDRPDEPGPAAGLGEADELDRADEPGTPGPQPAEETEHGLDTPAPGRSY